MNKQKTSKGNGIEWTDFTWNPIAGCPHACRWVMPDGREAKCYAEEVAHGVARKSYPQGFSVHYSHPDRLEEPHKKKQGVKIFLDSMSDLMSRAVSSEEIESVLGVVQNTQRHTYQLLTKNTPRLREFSKAFPDNLWVGVSMPPSSMFGSPLSMLQQRKYIQAALKVQSELDIPVRWWSFEPLSFDVGDSLLEWIEDNGSLPFEWAVIGAASNGRTVYQPEHKWVSKLLAILDRYEIPVFFKGNLIGSGAIKEWREEFPKPIMVETQKPLF